MWWQEDVHHRQRIGYAEFVSSEAGYAMLSIPLLLDLFIKFLHHITLF